MASALSTLGKRGPVTTSPTTSNRTNRAAADTALSAAGALSSGASAPFRSTTSIASNGSEQARERRYKLVSRAKELLPATARIQICMFVKPTAFGATVMVDHEAKKGYVKNGMCCGDLWACAMCAEKITGYRRDELKGAVERWVEAGNSVAVMTAGAAHHIDTDLKWYVDKLIKASSALMSGGTIKGIKAEYRWVGQVRALEYTYNVNGPNPHNHYLIFFEGIRTESEIGALQRLLNPLWQRTCKRYDLYSSIEHGVKITMSDKATATYVAKAGDQTEREWGAADEMTRHMHKRGQKDLNGIQKGFNQWELLGMSLWDKDDIRFIQEAKLIGSPAKAAKEYKRYYEAFHRRNQLVYSRGLRDLLGLNDELTDEQIAEQEPTGNFVAALELEREAYNTVLKRGKLALVIQLCIDDRMSDVELLLRSLGIRNYDLTQFDMHPPGRR